jgi:hypothetical protein
MGADTLHKRDTEDDDDDDNNNNNNNNKRGVPEVRRVEDFIRIWQLKTAYMIQRELPAGGIIPNKLHDSLKPLSHRPTLCILP